MIPSTIVISRDGSFALAFLGRVRREHDPIFLRPAEALAEVGSVALGRNNLALKRIVDVASCTKKSGTSCFLFRLQLREQDHVADAFLTEEHHAEAVNALPHTLV